MWRHNKANQKWFIFINYALIKLKCKLIFNFEVIYSGCYKRGSVPLLIFCMWHIIGVVFKNPKCIWSSINRWSILKMCYYYYIISPAVRRIVWSTCRNTSWNLEKNWRRYDILFRLKFPGIFKNVFLHRLDGWFYGV